MNELISIFLTWQFLVLCVGIAAITFVIRTVIEFTILDNPHMPGNRASRFWRDVVLVILPIVLGIIFAAVGKSFSYPAALVDPYSKFLFSASAGLLSPTLYRVIKAFLWKNVDGNILPPIPFFPQPTPPVIDPNMPVIDPSFPQQQDVNVNVNVNPTPVVNEQPVVEKENQEPEISEPKI